MNWCRMKLRPAFIFFPLLLTACATPGATDRANQARPGSCLYAVEMEYGRMMKWDSCTQPPPNAVQCFNCESR